MQYEVENKFPVAELPGITRRLVELGAELHQATEQVDVYFAHPARDFAKTDEALRIRRIGDTNLVTYKGPKIDKATKTRREIELPLASGAERVEDYAALLEALGFRAVADVRKRRIGGRLQWQQWTVELALDEVAELGPFVELEIVAGPDQLSAAQSAVLELASRLGLESPERRSYLEMVLEARGHA